MDFKTMSTADLTAALPNLSDDALTAALAVKVEQRDAILTASVAPTPALADEAEAHAASVAAIKTEQSTRASAAKRMEALRASVNDGVDEGPEEGTGEPTEAPNDDEGGQDADDDDAPADDDGSVEAAGNPFVKKVNPNDETEAPAEGEDPEAPVEGEDPKKKVVTASARPSAKSAAAKAAAANARPARSSASPVTITASSDVPGFASGSKVDGMGALTKALINRTKGFSPFNLSAAQRINEASGGQPVLNKVGLATFDVPADAVVTASVPGDDYNAVAEARRRHVEYLAASMAGVDPRLKSRDAMVAAGWCAPSEVVYSWVADYVVDGLKSVPSVSAPRGGLMTTTGPALADSYLPDGSDFGFVQTEAQAEARTVKTCETIICPDFEDHRLDAIGYCWKIPILTQKAYPELITDALRLSDALFAHKMNSRRIAKIIAESDPVNATGAMGGSVDDTLEALSAVAVRERRHFSVGVNAIMEVTLPQWVREVFRMDMTRRSGRALDDVATDQKINAEFAARNLAVEYVSDFDELAGRTAVYPGEFRAIMYPAGTFVEATEEVINLQAVYDAASLSVNEYTGVFFEQGHMLFKNAYRSSVVTIPVCTAGVKGASVLTCAAPTP